MFREIINAHQMDSIWPRSVNPQARDWKANFHATLGRASEERRFARRACSRIFAKP